MPLVILAMGKLVALPVRGWIGHRVAVHRECPLATPIVPWAALPFFHRGIEPIRILSPDMRTLISLGVGAASLCSLVAMVGVGVNDAPAPAAADVGIPMSTGAGVAVESTGITLMRGDLAGLVRARKLAAALIRFLPSAPMPRHSDGRLALSRIRRADTGASRPVGLDAGRPSSGHRTRGNRHRMVLKPDPGTTALDGAGLRKALARDHINPRPDLCKFCTDAPSTS
ncbi:hypothetical protein [Ponticoccus litoralis]|uniref:hypothetical protein n=1 Tax=Ponticoccus litoralis TaxID=422297 RepID=UPI003D2ED82C